MNHSHRDSTSLKWVVRSVDGACVTSIIPSGGSRHSRSSSPSPILITVIVLALVAAGVGAYALTRPSTPTPVAAPSATSTRVAKPTPTPTTKAAPSAATLLAQAKAAALAAGWVHVAVTVPNGSHTLSSTQISGLDAGKQTLATGSAHSTVLLVNGRAYISANPSAMTLMYHVTASDMVIWGGHWLRLLSANSGYASVTEGITLPSMLAQITPQGPLTLLPIRTLRGQRVVGIRGLLTTKGSAHPSATLWVAADGAHLPVEFDTPAPGGATSTAVMSSWGKAAALSPPEDVVVMKSSQYVS